MFAMEEYAPEAGGSRSLSAFVQERAGMHACMFVVLLRSLPPRYTISGQFRALQVQRQQADESARNVGCQAF
jgi:hypothetical protein